MKAPKLILISLVIIIIGFSVFVAVKQDKTYEAPYPDITATSDQAVLERGKYLIYGPAHCSGCHSPLEKQEALSKGEFIPLEGGFVFELPIGNIYTPNITPAGIGNISDQAIARALRFGVGFDGRPLFDFMPFHNLSDDDLTAIISYLRIMDPVEKISQTKELNLLGKILYALIIEPVGPEAGVDIPESITPDTSKEYGQYLANYVANCRGCHTNRDLKTGAYVGEFYAGGFEMPSPYEKGLAVVSPNLTPDPKTGRITHWTEEQFIARFRLGRLIPISEMPWDQFNQMSDDDLKAIYAYLKTLKPVENEINEVIKTIK